jgi:hypothetical protein
MARGVQRLGVEVPVETNALPPYDPTDNPTGCCPRFHPEGWDRQQLHFVDKPFVRAQTRSLLYVPLNTSSVFDKTYKAIQEAHAEGDALLVLSHDESPWHAEHLFSVARDVPGADMVRLSGDFWTRVFEGPYRMVAQWAQTVEDEVEEAGKRLDRLYFFYTTCPRCAKAYGSNYVVAVAQVS